MDFDKRLNDHIEGVKNYLKVISILLDSRGLMHDSTKKSDEEYNYYKMANSVNRNDFKTYEEYLDYVKPTLNKGLKHHYENNRHHPEYHKNVEEEIQYNFKKYNISEQLQKIILNTYKYIDDLINEE